MSGEQAAEPALADVQAEFPAWRCAQGTNYLYYAQHPATGLQVQGEDPLDLRDQIQAAERSHADGPPQPGPSGQAQTA